ncbi:MAG TPA: hypothetical protein VMW01_12135 [Williamwhitmania sp.]|nr:hypothetical protein [Williamwhitmania sp.]
MKNLIFALTILLLTSCGQNKTTEVLNTTIQNQDVAVVPDSLFRITSETENVNPKFGINKCNIEIVLKEKISKEQLTIIANKLRETRKSYDKLWIFYNLEGTKTGSGAWATSHFTPDLNVEIGGTTAEEDKKLNATKVDGRVIGKWQDTRPYAGCFMTLYEKNNKIFMNQAFSDGSSSDDEFIKKTINGNTRYELKQNKHNEYYIIETNGNLGMYGPDGKFGEAEKKN